MSKKQPTTAGVREAFIEYAGIVDGTHRAEAEAQFDAWLEAVKDEAYAEGRESGLASAALDAQYTAVAYGEDR